MLSRTVSRCYVRPFALPLRHYLHVQPIPSTLEVSRPPSGCRFMSVGNPAKDLQSQIRFLQDYSACDVSDALLKLQRVGPGQVARAGYLADIIPFAPSSPFTGSIQDQPKIIAPASTLKLVDKKSDVELLSESDAGAIPKGSHWVDMTDSGTIVVIEQPSGQTCAAIGGIMATRMKMMGVTGCLVGGRVRDLAELRKSGLPIWAKSRSTVGTGAESKVYARNVPVTIGNIVIRPGDIVFCDPQEGVVIIPGDLIDEIVQLMPRLVEADDKVKEAVGAGTSVAEAFQKFRG